MSDKTLKSMETRRLSALFVVLDYPLTLLPPILVSLSEKGECQTHNDKDPQGGFLDHMPVVESATKFIGIH